MFYNFCIDKKDIDLIEISQYFEANLGIKFHADSPTDTVNGSITAIHYPAGPKIGECWGGFDLSGIPGEHSCLTIEIYEVDKPPQGIQKTTIKKKEIPIIEIEKKCQAFMKNKKVIYFKPEKIKNIIVSAVS